MSKLGLRKLSENSPGDSEIATYSFKRDGNEIALTTKTGFGTYPTPMLFTKKIGRMKNVLTERGVETGPIESDASGTRYFEMRDPEGNVIEVVER